MGTMLRAFAVLMTAFSVAALATATYPHRKEDARVPQAPPPLLPVPVRVIPIVKSPVLVPPEMPRIDEAVATVPHHAAGVSHEHRDICARHGGRRVDYGKRWRCVYR